MAAKAIETMLHLHIRNTCTGTPQVGNYNWHLYCNEELVESGNVNGHERSKGWRDLVRMIAGDSPELERLRAENAALRERVAVLERMREDTDDSLRHLCRMAGPDSVLGGSLRGFGLWRDALDAAKDGAS